MKTLKQILTFTMLLLLFSGNAFARNKKATPIKNKTRHGNELRSKADTHFKKSFENAKSKGEYNQKNVSNILEEYLEASFKEVVEIEKKRKKKEQLVDSNYLKSIRAKLATAVNRNLKNPDRLRSSLVNILHPSLPGQCKKLESACPVGLNQCCGNSECRTVEKRIKGKTQEISICLPKIAETQSCVPGKTICKKGECRQFVSPTDVSRSCTEYGLVCKSSSDCCSSKCTNGRCEKEYRCSTCIEQGQQVKEDKGELCCDGLYPDGNGYCSPIIPSFSFNNRYFLLLKKFVGTAKASTTSSLVSEINSLSNQIKSNMPGNAVNTNDLISDINSKKSACQSNLNVQQRNNCLTNLKEQVQGVKDGVDALVSENKAAENAIKDARSSMGSSNLLDGAKKNCFDTNLNSHSVTPSLSNFDDITGSITSCLTSVKADAKNQKSYADIQSANLDAALNGKDQSNVVVQADTSDNNLFKFYNPGGLGTITPSDYEVCRIDLFSDFLIRQKAEFHQALHTFMAVDFVTSGLVDEDLIYLKKQGGDKRILWSLQTKDWKKTIMKEFDSDHFPEGIADEVSLDQFDKTIGESIFKQVNDYYDSLSAGDKKVFGYLYHNPVIKEDDKNTLMKYFSGFHPNASKNLPKNNLPPAESFNIFKLTRYNAIKVKFFLFKMHGKLAQTSKEMSCRCIDITGPMKGNEWIEGNNKYSAQASQDSILSWNIEKFYKNTCGGQGKYQEYVDISETGQKQSFGKNADKFLDPSMQLGITGRDSKASKFLTKDGKLDFNSERGKNKSGDGHGLEFSKYMRDLAITKVKAMAELAEENIYAISSDLMIASQFIRLYNWGYLRTKVVKFKKKGKKYPEPLGLLFILVDELNQLFGGKSFFEETYERWRFPSIRHKITYDGKSVDNTKLFDDAMRSFNLIPSRRCDSDPSYKWRTCGKYNPWPCFQPTYKCVKNVTLKNHFCDEPIPTGMCMKKLYVYNDGQNSSHFIIDPFMPNGMNMGGKPFLEDYKIRDFKGGDKARFKTLAKEFIGSQFFTYSTQEKKDFADFAFKYHFQYPKKARMVRYAPQGLAPYFEKLFYEALNLTGVMLFDIGDTALYAKKMNAYYKRIRTDLIDGVRMSGEFVMPENVEFDRFSTGVVSIYSSMHEHGLMNYGTVNFSRTKTPEMFGSEPQFGSIELSDQFDSLGKVFLAAVGNNKEKQRAKKYLRRIGKSGEYDKLRDKARRNNNGYVKSVSKFSSDILRSNPNSASAKAAGLGSSFFGKGGYFDDLEGGSFDSNALNSGKKSKMDSSKVIALNKKKSGKGSGSDKKELTEAEKQAALEKELLLDLSDLDTMELGDDDMFSLKDGTEVTGLDIKKFLKKRGIKSKNKQGLIEHEGRQLTEEELLALEAERLGKEREDYERNHMNLFKMVSDRYVKTAYPKFFIKKKASNKNIRIKK